MWIDLAKRRAGIVANELVSSTSGRASNSGPLSAACARPRPMNDRAQNETATPRSSGASRCSYFGRSNEDESRDPGRVFGSSRAKDTIKSCRRFGRDDETVCSWFKPYLL